MRAFALLLATALATSCSEAKDDPQVVTTPPPPGTVDPLPQGALIVKGSLTNADDPANQAVVGGQAVDIYRNDGTLVGTTTADANGQFAVSMSPGSLAVQGTGYSLQDTETDDETKDYKFYVQAAVPDDGTGKALGIKRRIKLTESAISTSDGDTAVFDVGETKLTEVSAITGRVVFADEETTATATDVYIPGQSFFARTGDDGAFQLLFVPEGTYQIRIQKGVYLKAVDVAVARGKTTKLGDLTVAVLDRNPGPLAQVLIGRWNTRCFYSDGAGGISPEAPVTGVIDIKALDDVTLVSGGSCLLRTTLAAPETFVQLVVPSDGAIMAKFTAMGGTYYLHQVASYSNDKITVIHSSYILGGNAIEVYERAAP